MKPVLSIKATILTVALSILLAGCGGSEEMSQEDIQFLSHVDQARFFQRQGELKASTLEARSAVDLQPKRIEPYLIIISNLLTAGDARTAERQLEELTNTEGLTIDEQSQNRIALIRAEANFRQRELNEALAALETLNNPDRAQELEANIIEGDVYRALGDYEKARGAYENAHQIDSIAALPLVGLSKTEQSQGDTESAMEYIRQAEEADPENEHLWLWKAQLAHTKGEWAEAEQAYIKALETIGQYDVMTFRKFETMSALVDVLRQQGKASEAFVYEEILAKSAPGTIRSNLIAAQEAFADGDLSAAARFLEEVLTQSPGNEQAALMLGITRFRQGRPQEAEEILEPLADLNDSEQITKLLAATRLQLRDAQGARQILETIDTQDSDPATLALVGIATLATGEIETGEQLIEKSLELNPDNNNLRLRYANYHALQGDPDTAIRLSEDAVERDPSSATAWQMLIRSQLAAENQESAIQTADRWLENAPNSTQALVTRGNIALQAQNTDEAKKFFQQAIAADPESAAPLVAMGRVEQSLGNEEQARNYFTKAARLAPDNRQTLQALASVMPREDMKPLMQDIRESNPDAIGPRLILLESALIDNEQTLADELTAGLLEREEPNTPAPAEELVAQVYSGIATQMAQRDRANDAADIFERGRVLFPDNETIGLQAATLQFRQGNATKARDILSDVKQSHPDSPSPFMVEARYFESQQEPRQAAELYQLALEKTPENVAIMLSLATAYLSSGQQDQATPLYEQIVERQPNNAVALNNLAWIYQEQGREEATDLALRAYNLAPDNAAIADTYGWILFNKGQTSESLKVLQKAHELAPDSTEIAQHLAEAHRAMGNEEKAREVMDAN